MRRRLTTFVAALFLLLPALAGPATTTAQDPDEQEPTLCELLEATRDRSCADAEEAWTTAQTEDDVAEAFDLIALCMRMEARRVEFCVEPGAQD